MRPAWAALLALACVQTSSPRPATAPARADALPPIAAPPELADESLAEPPGFLQGAVSGAPAAPPPPAREGEPRAAALVRSALLTIAAFDVEAELRAAEDLGRELGGFVARRSDRGIALRVPAPRFDEALRRLALLGDVLSREIQAEEVGEQVADLELRLRNARAVRERLEEVLRKAVGVQEILAVEKELERVATEIERLEGRLARVRDRIAYATVSIAFQPRPRAPIRPGAELPFPWLRELGLGRLLRLGP